MVFWGKKNRNQSATATPTIPDVSQSQPTSPAPSVAVTARRTSVGRCGWVWAGACYNEVHIQIIMQILFNKLSLEHNPESEFEGVYRIKDFCDCKSEKVRDGEKYLELVHTKRYINKIRNACRHKGTVAEIKLSSTSFESACLAVGLTILASEQNDFAIVRPPGHHAGVERASGFCLFNNVAIATKKLVNEGKKVFILDIDGHHGNGTQSIFYKTNKVFFCSIHQKDIFPGTGSSEDVGRGEGRNFTLNLPLPAGSGDEEFLSAVDFAIEKANEFKPDVIAISAGFDGYAKDNLLELNYSLNSYYECGRKICGNFKNVFAVLEGGYHSNIKECVDKFISGCNGE